MNKYASRFFAKGHFTRVTRRGNQKRKAAGRAVHAIEGHDSLPEITSSIAHAVSQLKMPQNNYAEPVFNTFANVPRDAPSWLYISA
jgi:hypothetical protein